MAGPQAMWRWMTLVQWQTYSTKVCAEFGVSEESRNMSFIKKLEYVNEDAAMWSTLYTRAAATPGAVTYQANDLFQMTVPAILMWAPHPPW